MSPLERDRTRGDFRGVTGNPHQVLIQQGLPPLKFPLGQGGTSPRATNFRKDSRILSHLQGCRGGVCRTGGPTPKADAFCPSLEGIFRGAPPGSLAGATEHEHEAFLLTKG